MATIPTPAEELASSKVNATARKIWEEALAQPEFANISVIWAYSASPASDHRNGRCADFMVTYTKTSLTRAQQVAMGDKIRAYFIKHAARLHVQGIIWNGKVTGFPIGNGTTTPNVTYSGPSGVARTYNGSDQHTDHNHIQVSGAPVTSWLPTVTPTPPVPVPPAPATPSAPEGSTDYPQPATCVVYHDLVKPGATDSDSVYWVQRWLNSVPLPKAPLLKLTGDYDADTVTAAREFQASLGDTVDGDLGPLETVALWGQASVLNTDLPKPTFVDPEPNVPKLLVTLNTGAGNTQGAIQDQGGDWFAPEATTEGDCRILRFGPNGGDPLDSMTLKVATGYEVHPVGWGVDNKTIWLTWNEKANDVVKFPYKAGTAITKAQTTTVHTFSTGNTRLAFSPGRDFCALERLKTTTEVYRRFAKQAVLDGVEEPIGVPVTITRDTTKRTVQGYTLIDDVLSVLTGRPSTGEATKVSRYSFTTGRPLDVLTVALVGEPETIDGNRIGLKVGTGSARKLKIYELR